MKTTYLSFLRGINVSGKKTIKMQELKLLYEKIGFSDVRTYIQSGNVVFDEESKDLAYLQKQIEEAIAAHFGFEVMVLVYTPVLLKQLLAQNPFISTAEPDKLYFTLLKESPQKEHFNIPHDHFLPDEFLITNTCVYVHCPLGYGKTKLSNTFFESKLHTQATTRNLRTMQEMLKLVP